MQLSGVEVETRRQCLQLASTSMDILWLLTVQHKLDTPQACGLSQSDHNRLKKCISYMEALATPAELVSIASLAPGAAPLSSASRALGLPATVARELSAKLFVRLTGLEKANKIKPVKSRAHTVNASLTRVAAVQQPPAAPLPVPGRLPAAPPLIGRTLLAGG